MFKVNNKRDSGRLLLKKKFPHVKHMYDDVVIDPPQLIKC